MPTPTPYEAMKAAAAERRAAGQRKVLNDYQRTMRKKANYLANRRAVKVLVARHRAEYAELAKTERHALYALIDNEAAQGRETDLFDLVED